MPHFAIPIPCSLSDVVATVILGMVVVATCVSGSYSTAAEDAVGYNDTPFLPNSPWRVHDRNRPQPPMIAPGDMPGIPPADAVVLFDGNNLSQWEGGNPAGIEDGCINILKAGQIQTKRRFGDCQFHIEWCTPAKADGNNLNWGNSGIYFMGKYELQIIESHDSRIYADGIAGAIYGQRPPLVNASRRPGQWQTYDVVFTTPRFEDGRRVEPAHITAFWNGMVVQNHTALLGPTMHAALPPADLPEAVGPILLQQHGSAVRFRNIWIRPLTPDGAVSAAPRNGRSSQSETSPNSSVELLQVNCPSMVIACGETLCQPVRLTIRRIGPPIRTSVRIGSDAVAVTLQTGRQDFEMLVPAGKAVTIATVAITAEGKTLASRPVTLEPVRPLTIYLIHHDHIDIGFTHTQPEVERRQWRNLDRAVELCGKAAAYPPEARFKWNTEVLWAVDSYLHKAPKEKQQRLIDAIHAGSVELDALYANELTGLCRPEELLRLCECSRRLAKRCGVKVDAAMISDVPGYTWGIVPALAQAGVKYFSIGPNQMARIGTTLTTWSDKPFYWLGPDGRQKVLCWVPYKGYATGWPGITVEKFVGEALSKLRQDDYPYDMAYLRWCCGDNGTIDRTLPDAVKYWNEKHVSPKLAIATTSTVFREFERRYGARIPTFRGDWTPYWEDGAGSSARETGINRTAAERLAQAETLCAMLNPRQYPVEEFRTAWRNVILYDEHTWGANTSISKPDDPFTIAVWKIKQAFALDADAQSRRLLASASSGGGAELMPAAIDVFNTCSWTRTDLVVLRKELSTVGDVVVDDRDRSVVSQRLSTGELAFLAVDVPGLAGRRYTIRAGKAATEGNARAESASLRSLEISLHIDPASGAISSLRSAQVDAELSDMRSGIGLNRYFYVLGDRLKGSDRIGPAKITIKEAGPLVASLVVESDAPGCVKLSREIRLIDGLARVDIVDVLDKKAVREKEGVHLGFAFNVPDGAMHLDVPWGVVRPELDQLPGACKNWLSVGRWLDVSNRRYGVTWATLDAPLVEIGGITAILLCHDDSDPPVWNPTDWLDVLRPSQTFYSWVMNNHWFTNYKADQKGATPFRYSIQPHRQYDQAAAQRFGMGCSQPLVVLPAGGAAPSPRSFVQCDSSDVVVVSLKPSNDCRAWIVRLFGASGRLAKVALHWGTVAPKSVYISNLAEECVRELTGPLDVPAYGLVTLRAERP